MLQATVNLTQLAHNIRAIRAHTRAELFLLPIKAGAYGHGAIPLATYVEQQGLVDMLGVAHMTEAFTLRSAGVRLPILVLSPSLLSRDDLITAAQSEITITLSGSARGAQYATWLAASDHTIDAHLAIDTGMGREGVLAGEIATLLETLSDQSQIRVMGAMTHLSTADEHTDAGRAHTERQLMLYDQALEHVRAIYPDSISHALSSAGCALYSDRPYTMIRPGIATYGYDFSGVLDVAPIMTITAPITLIKDYPHHHPIGYGATYRTRTSERIGLLPVGYGDGLMRGWGSGFTPSIAGERRQIRGRVSMDQISVTCLPEDAVGDRATLIGPDYSADDAARDVGTIPYEILTALGNAPRITHDYITDINS